MLFVCAWLVSLRVRNYQRGKPDDRRTTKRNLHRRLARLPRRRLDADAAARPRRRRHALAHLLRVPRGCSSPPSCSRSTTSSPTTSSSSTAASTRAYAFAADLAGVVFIVGILWAIGRRYVERPVPHPHQDQARGRGDPRHVPRDRGDRLPHRGVAHRPARPARLREVVVRRVPASSLFDGWSAGTLQDAHRWLWAVHFVAFLAFL